MSYAFPEEYFPEVKLEDSSDHYSPIVPIPGKSGKTEILPRAKRKRIVLSLKQKIDIIERLDKGEKASHIAKEYNIGTSSIADIRLKKDTILSYVSSFGSEDAMNKRKTMRSPINKELDEAVHNWYQVMRKNGYPITGQQLCEKALELNSAFGGSPDFKASSGWLKNFKSRHGLDATSMSKELDLNSTQNNGNYIIPTEIDNNNVSEDCKILATKSHPLPKRKRVVLSLKQKIDIIKKLREGSTASQLAKEYNIGTSSVTDIKLKQASILRYVACFESMDVMNRRKTMKPAYNKELDEAVYNWYVESQYSGKYLSGPEICEKALELNSVMGGSSDFKASNGWLQNFKSRHGLDFKLNDSKHDGAEVSEIPSSPEDWTLQVSPSMNDFQDDATALPNYSDHNDNVTEIPDYNDHNDNVTAISNYNDHNENVTTIPSYGDQNDELKSQDGIIDYNELLRSFDCVIQWGKTQGENCMEDVSNLLRLRDMAYKKAMSVTFSSEESEAIHRVVDAPINEKRDETVSLDDMYEIERCENWINTNNFSKIALQFPDSLLADAAVVAIKLEDLTGKQIFILGDTSYGSCCVDEIAAEHVSADSIIHFGHACLSPTKRLPVLYIFGKHVIEPPDVIDSFRRLFPDKNSFVALVYEVMYSYAISSIMEELSDYENVILSELDIPGEDSEKFLENKLDKKLIKVTKNHRHFFIPENQTLSNYNIFYIGFRNVTLTNFMLAFPKCSFYSYNPAQKLGRAETLDINKHLKRRYFYIEKAKDANIIGILVGTLGVTNYLTTINHLKELIKSAGKKSYTLAVGKLNSAKLANFAEIDIFVYVACVESSLIESKEFYQPIITPYELEISLNQARQWTGDYLIDFSEILPGAANYVPFNGNCEHSDVSLVTGKIRHTGLQSENETELSENTVAVRNNMELSNVHSQGAGEFLAQRSWKGLEQKLGETSSAEIEEGKRGIASAYDDENAN